MLIAARNAMMAGGGKAPLPWVDLRVFDASIWNGTSDNWYATSGNVYFNNMTSVAEKSGDMISIPSNPQSTVPNLLNMTWPTVFRVLLDAVDVTISSTQNTILLDNSIGTVGGDENRGFLLGYETSGKAYHNWKMKGNNSGSSFNPTNSTQVFTPPQVVSGVFECGVRPESGGLVCYTAFNGVDNSVGPVKQLSDFGTGGMLNARLFRSLVQGYGSATGKIKSLKIQTILAA